MRKSLNLIICCLLIGFCGCTQQIDPNVPVKYVVGGSASDDRTVTLMNEGKTTVKMHAPYDKTGAMASVIDKFNIESDEFYIQYHSLDSEKNVVFEQFLLMQSVREIDYDLLLYDISLNADFASRGFVANLESYIEEDGINLDNYLSNAIRAVQYNDGIYSLPVSVGITMLFFRRDIIITAPSTWEDLIAVSQEAVNGRKIKNGLVFEGKISFDAMYLLLEILNTYGVRLFDENGYPSIDGPKAYKALEIYRDMYTSQFVPSTLRYMSPYDAYNSFSGGDSMLMLGLSSGWKYANNKNSKIMGKFAAAPIPKSMAQSDINQLLTGTVLAIDSHSENIDGAWECLKYIISPSAQKILAVSGGYSPSLLEIYDNTDAQLANTHFAATSYKNALFNADTPPISTNTFNCMMILNEQIANYITGLNDTDTTIDIILNEMRKVVGFPAG